MENIIKLKRKEEPLVVTVIKDEFIEASEKAFDCAFNGVSEFYPWEKPIIPEKFNIGVIVGSSGSGKSTLLKEFGLEKKIWWDRKKPIVSWFKNPDEAINRLSAVGLNSIPSWYKPFHVLSNGEKFRAELGAKLENYAIIDEYTSVVDRNVAKASSVALNKYIRKNDLTNIVLCTCHEDVLEWLEPDWVINTDEGNFYPDFFQLDQISNWKYIAQKMISGPCLKTITI